MSGASAGVADEAFSELNRVRIEFLLLADRAEAVNGKLYMMGGAWDRIFLPNLQQPHPLSLAIALCVPWNATNVQHQLTISIEDTDSQPVGFRAEMTFAAGRPPWLEQGDAQRVMLAVPMVPVNFPA